MVDVVEDLSELHEKFYLSACLPCAESRLCCLANQKNI